jgi:Tol biopolymer transport system component
VRTFLFWLGIAVAAQAQQRPVLFETAGDIGDVATKGSVVRAAGEYRISASGANIWGAADAFHYAHQQATGDVVLTASVRWASPGGDPHKKAGLMLRAGLDAGAAHVSAMAHADGLLSLQFRRTPGGPTEEVRTGVNAPVARLRLARHGDVFSMEVARPGGEFQPVGALTVTLPPAVAAGLAVCSHNNADTQTAVFSGVEIEESGVVDPKARAVESTLEVYDLAKGERRIVRRAIEHFEAPNWTPDGTWLYFNGGGNIYRIPPAGGAPEHVPTGNVRVNNDHGISADGKLMVISGRTGPAQSQIFILPLEGGTPRLVTPNHPSYWHGWSPDGKTLVYAANREGEFDIYAISVEGGEERRLTASKGLDDGPEYSPDGKYLFFNSERSGLMRIWRMNADGSDQRMFSQGSETGDWFAHPSPDGKLIVYLSYDKSVQGHPANKDVTLNLVPFEGGLPRRLVTLFGGQGTINVPSWSPDSKQFAFVSYRLVPKR